MQKRNTPVLCLFLIIKREREKERKLYENRFQMFVIRSFRRFYSTDLIKTSSTAELTPKSPTDSSLWATSETNRLIDYLATRIQSAGPITVADYMREALFHSKYVRM